MSRMKCFLIDVMLRLASSADGSIRPTACRGCEMCEVVPAMYQAARRRLRQCSEITHLAHDDVSRVVPPEDI